MGKTPKLHHKMENQISKLSGMPSKQTIIHDYILSKILVLKKKQGNELRENLHLKREVLVTLNIFRSRGHIKDTSINVLS